MSMDIIDKMMLAEALDEYNRRGGKVSNHARTTKRTFIVLMIFAIVFPIIASVGIWWLYN